MGRSLGSFPPLNISNKGSATHTPDMVMRGSRHRQEKNPHNKGQSSVPAEPLLLHALHGMQPPAQAAGCLGAGNARLQLHRQQGKGDKPFITTTHPVLHAARCPEDSFDGPGNPHMHVATEAHAPPSTPCGTVTKVAQQPNEAVHPAVAMGSMLHLAALQLPTPWSLVDPTLGSHTEGRRCSGQWNLGGRGGLYEGTI